MCPITLVDPELEWLAAIRELTAELGEGNFCALDVAERAEIRRTEYFIQLERELELIIAERQRADLEIGFGDD
ncbi:hypothetical protein PBI_TOURACH_3 [Mycobacterium phage Tourach]|uniref:Uncharacterized protein n=1 Tax=Mycobacterium phage Tourach TaxID=2599882 RepID=A0A5J6U0L8_9CAUD|nr:hypothetical protein J4T98_gp003 [Mycobacterium phage Tourach]QFG14242.1 hypothetical protein PBI_TOURACH_3 [Mycobacterium phage Tourach]